jgi:hypothetical protein
MGLILLLVVAGSACKYPAPPQIEQADSRPAIGVTGAPEGATLFVDGLEMGLASKFDGKKHVLLVESGTHKIEVKSAAGGLLHSETVFLSSSTTMLIRVAP